MAPPRVRLFCLPYAGGSAALFRKWPEQLRAHGIEAIPVELPGRGARFKEPPISDMGLLADRVLQLLGPQLELPYALFGHSMGALIAFECARRIAESGRPLPMHLIVCACRAPHVPDAEPHISRMADQQVIERLRWFGGTSEVVLQDPELMGIFIPIVRSDAAVTENYRYDEGSPLACDMTVFEASNDELVSHDEIKEWDRHTSLRFRHRRFDADHVFSKSFNTELVRGVEEVLSLHGETARDEHDPGPR